MSAARTILVVEDDDAVRDGICLGLRQAGFSVVEALSLAAALHALDLNNVDLLLTDHGLPDGTGLELVKTARTRGALRAPALLVSGDADAMAAEGVAVLAKPFSLAELVARVRELTGGTSSECTCTAISGRRCFTE